MIQSVCPSDEEIRNYLHGRISEESGDLLQGHVTGCDICRLTIEKMEQSDDSLMRHLRLASQKNHERIANKNSQSWISNREALYRIPENPTSDVDADESDVEPTSEIQPLEVYHYRLEEILGRGGMGVVYRSWHPQLHRPVAVKLLSIARAADNQSIARFQREMRAAGGLDHPGIVRALDAGVWQGTNYLVMEYVDGVDLSRLIRSCGPLSVADAAAIIVQLCDAIQSAHDSQVVHRDIKPSNVMLTRDGTVKILDFGLARLEHGTGSLAGGDATSAGRLLGTLDYLSPEQARGEQEIDHRADIYAIGATLFRLLTGRPPHGASRDRSVLEHLQRLSTGDPDNVSDVRSDLPSELCRLIQSMLSREVENRPESASAISDALRPLSKDARLRELAEHSLERLEFAGEKSDSRHSIGQNPRPAALPKVSREKSGFGKVFIATLLTIGGLIAGAYGMTLWLSTGDGTVKIESEVDDVRLQLIAGGKVAEEIEVQTGAKESTIRAGKYEIRIAGGSDNIRVDRNTITLRRGDHRLVKITKSAPVVENVVDDGPTSRGRTHAQWSQIVLRETDEETLIDAIDSLKELTNQSNARDTIETCLPILHRLAKTDPALVDTYFSIVKYGSNEAKRHDGLIRPASQSTRNTAVGVIRALRDASKFLTDDDFDSLLESKRDVEIGALLIASAWSKNEKRTIALCNRYRSLQQSDAICALANSMLLTRYEMPPDDQIRTVVNCNRRLTNLAVGFALLDDEKFPFPKEQGLGWGWLEGNGFESRKGYLHATVEDITSKYMTGEKMSSGEQTFAKASAQGISNAWKELPPDAETWNYTETINFLAAFEAIDEDLQRDLVNLLSTELLRRLKLREERQEIAGPRSQSFVSIAPLAQTLTFLTGEVPKTLFEYEPGEKSRVQDVMEEFAEYLKLNPNDYRDDMESWRNSHPLAMTRLLLKQSSDKDVVYYLGLNWLAFAVVTDEDELDQTIVKSLLSRFEAPDLQSKVTYPKYISRFNRVANEHDNPTTASAALRIGQLYGLPDDVVEKRSIELLEIATTMEGEASKSIDTIAYSNALQCLADLDKVTTPKEKITLFTNRLAAHAKSGTSAVMAFTSALQLHDRLDTGPEANRNLIQGALNENRYRNSKSRWRSSDGQVWRNVSVGVPDAVIELSLKLIKRHPFPEVARPTSRSGFYRTPSTTLARLKSWKQRLASRFQGDSSMPDELTRLNEAIELLTKANDEYYAANPDPLQGISDRYVSYASRLIDRYDKNDDGELTSGEWKTMLMTPKPADTNDDDVITLAEYAKWMSVRAMNETPNATPADAKKNESQKDNDQETRGR